MKRGVGLCLAALMIAAFLVVQPYAAKPAYACDVHTGCPETSDTGYTYYYDESTSSYHERPTGTSERAPVRSQPWQWKDVDPMETAVFRFICTFLGRWDVPCEPFLVCAQDDGDVGFIYILSRRATPGTEGDFEEHAEHPEELELDEWAWHDFVCRAPVDDVTLEEIRDSAQESFEEDVPQPELGVSPDPRGVVNLPVVVWTEDQGEQVYDITEPLPGRIEARPTYTWRFGDGTTAEGVGRPYDGTDPVDNPDYYVSHAYDTVGTHDITLEVNWQAWVFVGENEPQRLEDLLITESTPAEIVELDSVLTGR